MSDRIILGPDGRKYITNEPLLHEDKQAAELRRLHSELERKSDAIQRLWKERDELRSENRTLVRQNGEWQALNAELVEALQLALSSYGVMKMGDPPQEAWDVWKVEEKARAALAKVEASK